MAKKIKVFTINRQFDESGISGTGHVITGVEFPNGKIVICWESDMSSISIYNSWDDFYKVHIGQHPSNESIVEQVYLNVDDAGKIAINIGELLINQ